MIREVLTLERLRRLGAAEAAALLLVRQDAGDDGHDDAVFDAWLADDPVHAEAWARACAAWTLCDDADDDTALQEMRAAARDRPAAQRRWGLTAAASIAVIAATGSVLLFSRQSGTEAPRAAQVASGEPGRLMLATAKGEQRSFTLADASVVTLNTDSRVAVAFRAGGERRLELVRGQALFKVAHDRTRPFVVAFEGRTVTALGTQFEVRADTRALRVVLVEGRVSFARTGSAPVVMRAGQQLVDRPSGVVVSNADLSAIEDWQRGVVTFKSTPLSAAAAELNRYSRAQLTVDDPRAAGLTVSGVFRANDAQRFARTIQAIYPVRVVPAADGNLKIVLADPSRG